MEVDSRISICVFILRLYDRTAVQLGVNLISVWITVVSTAIVSCTAHSHNTLPYNAQIQIRSMLLMNMNDIASSM